MSFTVGAGTRFIVTSTTNPSGGSTVSGPFTITGGTATTNTPVLDATQTWNAGGVTFTGWRLNVTDTASAANSLLLDLQTGGSSRFEVTAKSTDPFIGRFSNAGIERVRFSTQGSGASVELFAGGVNSFIGFGTIGASDARLYRDDPNSLGQRVGLNAQTFSVYNFYTDSSNYERGFIRWSGNQLQIGPDFAGTGVTRNLVIRASAGGSILFNQTGTGMWVMTSAGHYVAAIDNIYDIGQSTARPRSGWFGSELMVGGTISAGSETIDVLGGTKAPQFAASTQTNNGFAAVVAAVRDGANNRRAGIYVDDSDATWGLASKYSSGGADFVLVNNSQRMVTATTSGNVIVGAAALATNATDGFFYTPSCAGAPTGVPTAYTGRIPMVVDTTNLRVYFNIGGTWRYATLT